MYKKIIFFFGFVCGFGFMATAQETETQIVTESGTPLEDYYVDGVVKRTLIDESPVLEFDQPRESDVVWERKLWRVIDVREKMNIVFRSPHLPFFNVIKQMAENGDVAVFKDEFFKEPMTIDDIQQKLSPVDTVTSLDYDTYEETVNIVRNDINYEDVKQFRVKEVWYFDKETARMKCRILGIAPLLDRVNLETGEFKYTEVLFWIYYPEAKEHFARVRVENDNNDISPMSWYDLFEMRFFSSYIMKQSNTLNMRLADIYQGYEREGIDRLMESDKIKAELFNFEHDLWEY